MLFQVARLTPNTDAILAALRALDAGVEIKLDLADGQVAVSGQLTSDQALGAIRSAGYEAVRAPEVRQVHVSGGSDCCGSCS